MICSSSDPTSTTKRVNFGSGEFMLKRILAFLRECGCEMVDLTHQSDQEPVMDTIFTDVARERAIRGAMRTVLEHSPG